MGSAQITRASSLLRLVWLLSLLLLTSPNGRAELLPVKTYTTADGLLRDTAFCIVQDSRGFLWFCTADGLSRFDGYGFTNYTTDDGLPHRVVNGFLETRSGVYWAATNDGLARFNPKVVRGAVTQIGNQQSGIVSQSEPMFVSYKPEDREASKTVEVLFEDAKGKLWCGTHDGLYWLEERDKKVVFHRFDFAQVKELKVLTIAEDQRGSLWVGTDGNGLYRLLPDGRIEHYTVKNGLPLNNVTSLLADRLSRIWVGMPVGGGACQLIADPDPYRSVISNCYTKQDGLADTWVRRIYQISDGTLWFSTTLGTTTFKQINSTGESVFRTYKQPQGLCDGETWSVLEDRDGNIWVSTNCGIKKIARSGFVRFTQADGLASLFVAGILSSRAGELFAVTKQTFEPTSKTTRAVHSINRFDEYRFTFATPRLPADAGTGWGGGQVVAQDRDGAWWIPSDKGAVYRFAKSDNFSRLAVVKPQTISIPDKEVFRIYEDSRGDVWISSMYDGHLLKWERTTETFRDYRKEIFDGTGTCFAEDSAGNLWAGFDYGEAKLARYQDGHFKLISTDEIRSSGGMTSLHFDHVGRLWFTSKVKGVGRIDNPNTENMDVVWYDRKKGLATDGTSSLAEDKFGRIYVGHGRGVDRIDPDTGQIRHYTTADGLPQGAIHFAARDNQNSLWFGSYGGGLARLTPEPDKVRQRPTILLTGLRIAGQKQPVSDLGETTFPQLTLTSSQNQISIDFVGLGASLGEELRYQYRLEGTQRDWSEPTTQRTVDFAQLAPGRYRLVVRAVTAEGAQSTTPAAFTFTILRPVWQRWWFLLMLAMALTLILVALYRYRVRRLLELERIRTRIASDLHDDIGASLSRIAIMSEVVKRQVAGSNGESGSLLTDIADSARELTGSMRDIVWAIDPRRDDLGSVVARIRQFASDVLEAKGIKWEFQTPAALDKIQLGPDQRRHILLFFKEAINNIARHSNCTTARLSIEVERGNLIGEVRDDGQGLELQPEGQVAADLGGHGLENMKRRVTQLGGTFSIDSTPGEGMRLRITMPLRKP